MIQLHPIGIVRNAMRKAHRDTPWAEIESEIIIAQEWRDALDGLAAFSHLWIVFYLDRAHASDALRVQPMRRADLPRVGIFATRSPSRPNPLGICAAELISIDANILRVRGLDALDGTPVLDLKPYLERGDAITNTRVGAWVKQYWSTLPAKTK
ncbi:MAG: tRNA (N6-threonylcarbamoyladenosine(37)-N6)-methyltransferase TrmO [Chloroflexi bacterium]|nr:tRNA (N6-threonylcarbamoyladenosine(37)-N6)-methyltransferase TrmO [Chloroflexota bacterium]